MGVDRRIHMAVIKTGILFMHPGFTKNQECHTIGFTHTGMEFRK